MTNVDLNVGDEVLVPWGPSDHVRGTMKEIYGLPSRPYAIVWLTPDLSEHVVMEPTTVSWPVDLLAKASPAA